MEPVRGNILDLSADDLVAWCESHGERAFRAGQIRRWLFQNRAHGFEAMLDLPQTLRIMLAGTFTFFAGTVTRHQVSSDRTEKLLIQLTDGNTVECVLMRETNRRTVCISTQVGCGMGCVFCASGLLGLKRNLTRAEILEQILRVDRLLDDDERLTNLVVMGIGEPLQNLPQLLPALTDVTAHNGLAMSPRRVTISTVGLPDKIRQLAAVNRSYNLAVSLHAPSDALRDTLVPVNGGIGIDAILAAADEYFRATGRRITYEYVLLGSINDQPRHAHQLADLLAGRNAHVNLIPMNSVETLPFHEPTEPDTGQFIAILESRGTVATVRKRKGADIDAACGQLRLSQEQTGSLPIVD